MGIGIGSSFKGFEIYFAALRMFWQMLLRLILFIFILHVIITVTICYSFRVPLFGGLDKTDICLIRTNLYANFGNSISFNTKRGDIVYTCEGSPIKVSYNNFQNTFGDYIEKKIERVKNETLRIFMLLLPIYFLIPFLIVLFSRSHKKQMKDKHIRGAKFVDSNAMNSMINDNNDGEVIFKIGKIVGIPHKIVTRHQFIIGRPGSGKTQLILRVIDQIKKLRNRAIIHDFKGDLISSFYDYKQHYIFNPLDKRHMGLKDREMYLIDKLSGLKHSDLEPDQLQRCRECYTQYLEQSDEKISRLKYDLNEIKESGKSSAIDSQAKRIEIEYDSIVTKRNIILKNISSLEKCSLPIFSFYEYDFLLDVVGDIAHNIKDSSSFYSINSDRKYLDHHRKGWSILKELESDIEIDAFCASLIPESASNDNFWPVSSRQLLGSIISYCKHHNLSTYDDMWRIVNLSNSELLEYFKNISGCEEGVRLLSEDKTANNILAVLSNYTKPFKYLRGTDGDVSIKDWVRSSESSRRIIFLSNYSMIQETIKPFLTMFFDFSTKILTSMPDDLNRRLHFILDEFGELSKIGSINSLLTQSRSKGGCVWILIQDVAKMHHIYGKDIATSIINSCGNTITFAVADESTADFLSKKIGSEEIKRSEESKSMGVDDLKDSISINRSTTERRIVLPSEIMDLQSMNYYVQLTDFGISRDSMDYVKFPQVAIPYIGRSPSERRIEKKSESSTPINTEANITNPSERELRSDELFNEIMSIEKAEAHFGVLEYDNELLSVNDSLSTTLVIDSSEDTLDEGYPRSTDDDGSLV